MLKHNCLKKGAKINFIILNQTFELNISQIVVTFSPHNEQLLKFVANLFIVSLQNCPDGKNVFIWHRNSLLSYEVRIFVRVCAGCLLFVPFLNTYRIRF